MVMGTTIVDEVVPTTWEYQLRFPDKPDSSVYALSTGEKLPKGGIPKPKQLKRINNKHPYRRTEVCCAISRVLRV